MAVSKWNLKTIEKTIFFIMMWVFYSLNSRYFQIPYAHILRWLFLAALIGCVLLIEQVRIGEPPKLLALYLLAVVPSVFFSVDITESVVKILSMVIVLWGTYVYFISLKTKEELETLMVGVLWIILAFEVQNIICLVLGLGMADERATLVTTNPNTLGIYSNLALIAAMYLLTKRKRKGTRWLYYFIIVMSVVTAIMSGSRTALITLFVNVVLLAFLKIKSVVGRSLWVILVGTFAVLLLSGTLGDLGLPALGKLLEGEVTRGELWEIGINTWKRFPLFGCGYSVSAEYNIIPGAELQKYDFHNSYLTILAEVGIWGSLLLIIGVFFVLKDTLTRPKRKGELPILVVVFLIIFEIMIAAWSESFLFAVGSTEACLFWVLLIWISVYKKRLGKNNNGLLQNIRLGRVRDAR